MNSKPNLIFLPSASLLLSATLWGLLWYPLRLLAEQGLSGVWTTLIAFGAAALVSVPWLWSQRREFIAHWPMFLLLAFSSGWCNLSFILAMLDGSVVRVLLLFYLAPLWTVILGWLILKEKISRSSLGVLSVAMVGAILMLWSSELGFPWPQNSADWLALSSGLGFALTNVLVRRGRSLSSSSRALTTWWGAVLLAAIWALVEGVALPAVSSTVIVWAMLLGAVGLVVATVTVQYGVSRMPVNRSAIILLFELVAGALSAHWLTSEVVQPVEWLGGGVILLAAWLAVRGAERAVE